LHSFEINRSFPVSPETIYEHWLNGSKHALMTGGEATCIPESGTAFSAWDGYITGKNLELVQSNKIVQSWRSADFEPGQLDSTIELTLLPTDTGCELTLKHTNIPDGQPDYEQGWNDHYFEPMSNYFKTMRE